MKKTNNTGRSVSSSRAKSTKVLEHGGPQSKGKRKSARPISTKSPMKLVFHSSRAKGLRSFSHHNHRQVIREIVSLQAHAFGVQIISYKNGGTQLELTIQVSSRRAFQRFMRSASGLIARAVLKAQRGSPKNLKFWDHIPYSKIL